MKATVLSLSHIPKRALGLICAGNALFIADIKKPRGCEADIRLVLRLILRAACHGSLLLHHRLPAFIILTHYGVKLLSGEALLVWIFSIQK